MIEFSKIKKITIKEGVVKKITNSSGVVLWSEPSTDTGSIVVDLNNQWVASTKKLDGYLVFMSNSNKGVGNGYASMKIKFKGKPDFKIWINSYAESSFDYTIAFNMDVDYPTSNPSTGSTGVKLHTREFQKDPTTIDNFIEVDYPNDGGEHFVVVTFRKDSSANANDDRGYVAVKLKLLSTTWVLSSTEFVKDSDKYYQRINEVGTYEGGITAPTGSFKKGNELTPTYIQSDASDYILVGSSMYYKKYAYVTPVDTAINTGDYIQGDYIGESTPSMKVTYTDGTEKTFYNLTSIEAETIPNKANAKSVEIYDGVSKIGQNAFSYCQALSSINIPNSVVSIDVVAFLDCSSITSINIPSGVTGIESGTFAGCSGLTSITIPSGVTYISNQAFQNCSSITSITIPSGVTYISSQAFQDCIKLAEVTIENSTSKLAYNTNAFGEISPTAKLYVPSNLLSEYQADENWTGAFPGGIYAIPKNETVVTYKDGTTKEFDIKGELRNNSIDNISAATKVDIGDSVTKVGGYSLQYCHSLSAVNFSESVTEIYDYSFNGCEKLKELTFPPSVIGIYSAAFNYCSGLTSVTIKNSSNKLDYFWNTFYGISSSAKLYVPSNLLADYQADAKWTGAFKGGIYAIGS